MIETNKSVPESSNSEEAVVTSLQVCPGHRASMQVRQAVSAIENLGLEGDRHAIPNASRQVLLVEQEVLDRFGLAAGTIKENITTRGVPLMSLKRGTRLKIGAAILELTKECEPCTRMDEIRMGLQDKLDGQRGMLARVIQGGEIRTGDRIEIVGG